MPYDKRETATFIAPGGQSYKANIEYRIDKNGISGTITPLNLVTTLGQFMRHTLTLALNDGTSYKIMVSLEPRWEFHSTDMRVIKVKAKDAAVNGQQRPAAERVLNYFGDNLPSSVLCFLDDADWSRFKTDIGPANRGLQTVVRKNTFTDDFYPPELKNSVSVGANLLFDYAIYLHGSTCANEVGLTMTLAHELQHTIQHANMRQVWAVNALVNELDRTIIQTMKLEWKDVPTEREARIVSKRAALQLHGEKPVEQYIDANIAAHITPADVSDWQFIRTLTPSSSVDLVGDTHLLFQRLKGHRAELEQALQRTRADNPQDFGDIDLDVFLGKK